MRRSPTKNAAIIGGVVIIVLIAISGIELYVYYTTGSLPFPDFGQALLPANGVAMGSPVYYVVAIVIVAIGYILIWKWGKRTK